MQEEKLRMFEARLPRWKCRGSTAIFASRSTAASNHMTRLFVALPTKARRDLPAISGFRCALGAWPRRAVGDLASLLHMEFGTLSPMLKRIESKGLITRQRQATDERRVLIDLNAEGAFASKADRADAGGVFTAF